MRFAWCTDIHLDFLDSPGAHSRVYRDFAAPLSKVDVDGIFITGDISLSHLIVKHLKILDDTENKPIYFVCGNHDFYGGSMVNVRNQLKKLCASSRNLKYLTQQSVISLTDKVGLVGHDGWYDAMIGDPFGSGVVMNDWLRIKEYRDSCPMGIGPMGPKPHIGSVVSLSRKLAFEAADKVMKDALRAAERHDIVFILTHVPPFPQVHKDNPKTSSPAAFPWYTSKLMADAILDVSSKRPDVKFEVFCGHTHGQYDGKVTDNVTVHVGGSQYGRPSVVGVIGID